jgi:hypothetical protein
LTFHSSPKKNKLFSIFSQAKAAIDQERQRVEQEAATMQAEKHRARTETEHGKATASTDDPTPLKKRKTGTK